MTKGHSSAIGGNVLFQCIKVEAQIISPDIPQVIPVPEPIPPAIVARFFHLEEIIRYDPGLTANILKLTNSAYFGIPLKVSSVKQAMTLLGWKRLLQLVMTLCMSTLMKKPVPGYDLPQGELWRHSIAVSIAAENIVKTLTISDAEDIFTAALLHDVGKLALGGFVKKDLEFIEDMVAKGLTFDVAEHVILGTDHAEVGSHILKQWSFPDELVNAVC